MQNPPQRISPVQRKTVFFTFLGLTILLMINFARTGAPLFTSAAPQGWSLFNWLVAWKKPSKLLHPGIKPPG